MTLISNIAKAYKILRLLPMTIQKLPDLPIIKDLDRQLACWSSASLGLTNANTLDLGCGPDPWNPFRARNVFGIDLKDNPKANIKYADLAVDPIPFPDQSFDYISAHNFIEHIPRVIYMPNRRLPFVELMNEIWRVLKPGGIFVSKTPIFPYAPVFSDPTHVNIITHQTFLYYFDKDYRWAQVYGFIGYFEVVYQGVDPPFLISVLRKICKPE